MRAASPFFKPESRAGRLTSGPVAAGLFDLDEQDVRCVADD